MSSFPSRETGMATGIARPARGEGGADPSGGAGRHHGRFHEIRDVWIPVERFELVDLLTVKPYDQVNVIWPHRLVGALARRFILFLIDRLSPVLLGEVRSAVGV